MYVILVRTTIHSLTPQHAFRTSCIEFTLSGNSIKFRLPLILSYLHPP
jgi:hypothetical protein